MADRKTANRANVKSYEIILIARSYFLIIRYTGEINNLYHHTFWWNWRFIPQNIFSTSRDFLDFFLLVGQWVPKEWPMSTMAHQAREI